MKIKQILSILAFSALLLTSCEKEDNITLNSDSVNQHIQKISYEKFLNDIKSHKINTEDVIRNVLNKNNKENNLSLEIIDGDVTKIISTNNLLTYTIGVKTNDTDSRPHYYRLILIVQGDHYDFKLLKFLPNVVDNNLPNHITSKYNGTIENIPFSGNSIVSKSCTTVTYREDYWAPCVNHGHYEATEGCDGGHWESRVVTQSICSDISDGGGWTPDPNQPGGGGNYDGSYPIDPAAYEELESLYLDFMTIGLDLRQQQYLRLNSDVNYKVKQYLIVNSFSDDSKAFVRELIDLARNQTNQTDASSLFSIVLIIDKDNYYENPLDEAFLNKIDPYVDLDLSNQEIHNPIITQLIIKYQVLKALNPNWSKAKLLWETTKDVIHLSLDTLGLVPLFGEVADLTNGVIYTLEGDHLNATLSYASTIPIAGWVSASTKFGLKVVNSTQTAYAISTKVKLVWKISGNVITFGQQSQLRKVLGMAASSIDSRQAHHLIPWATQGHEVIQKAAKSGSTFHMNEALNGIAVAAWRNQPNHNDYNNLILSKLNYFKDIQNPNASPQECYDFIQDLIHDIRSWVVNHPNSHLNDLILP